MEIQLLINIISSLHPVVAIDVFENISFFKDVDRITFSKKIELVVNSVVTAKFKCYIMLWYKMLMHVILKV